MGLVAKKGIEDFKHTVSKERLHQRRPDLECSALEIDMQRSLQDKAEHDEVCHA